MDIKINGYYAIIMCTGKKNKMKPTNPNAHTYVENNDVKVSIMI